MEFENSAWVALDDDEREAALEWVPASLHSQLRTAFRSCVAEEEARATMFFDLGKTHMHAIA